MSLDFNILGMTWNQVGEIVSTANLKHLIAVWPWGSIEQHGPRMPIETDTMIAQHFANHIAKFDEVIELPTMPFGMARHHEAFPGTLSLSMETATGLATEVMRSLRRMGVKKLMVLLGHGGNVAPFNAALEIVRSEIPDLKVCEPLMPLFYAREGDLGALLRSFDEEVSHAGAAEASLVYAIMKKHGRHEDIAQLQNIPITDKMVTFGKHGQGTKGGDPQEFLAMFPSGSKGDQRKANLGTGHHILSLMEQALTRALQEFRVL